MMTKVMGVLNVTPDSFSDGGRFLDPAQALDRAATMLAEGADVIDVGGESTRPGAEPVDPLEEQRRVIPIIEALADLSEGYDRPLRISIDTRNSSTAERAVEAGASLINDVSAGLWEIAAKLGVGWVAMHMLGDPRTMQREPKYDDVVGEVRSFLLERATRAAEAGVSEVWIDPGIGFGKTALHNLQLLAHLDLLANEGFPVLVGTSRKRFLGELLGRSDSRVSLLESADSPSLKLVSEAQIEAVDVLDRLDGSIATATWAMFSGAAMVRVHDVRATVHAARVVSGNIGDP